MRAILLAATLCGMAVSSLAAGPNPQRMQQIWGAAFSRMTAQNDIWFDEGDYPRIIQLLRVMHDIAPEDYQTVDNLGWLLESTEATDEALALYVSFRRQNPAYPDAPFPEANFYFKRKLYSKIPPLLEPTLGELPDPNSFRLLAHTYERLNLLKDSKRIWEHYLTLPLRNKNVIEAGRKNLDRVERKLRGGK